MKFNEKRDASIESVNMVFIPSDLIMNKSKPVTLYEHYKRYIDVYKELQKFKEVFTEYSEDKPFDSPMFYQNDHDNLIIVPYDGTPLFIRQLNGIKNQWSRTWGLNGSTVLKFPKCDDMIPEETRRTIINNLRKIIKVEEED